MDINPYEAPRVPAPSQGTLKATRPLPPALVIGAMFACAIVATLAVSIGVAIFADWVWTRP